jgi:plastocyanin
MLRRRLRAALPGLGLLALAGSAVGSVDSAGAAASSKTSALSSISGEITGLRPGQAVVVSLDAAVSGAASPAAAANPTAVVDQKRFQFAPALLPVRRGTTVRFLNSDREPHNVFSPEGGYDLGTWGPGEWREHRFDTPGVFSQRCNLHPEMRGRVVVVESPYFAVTDDGGRYAIPGVPAGAYRLRVWLENGAVERAVRLEAGRPAVLSLSLDR